MVAATERGLLLTCLWYIREVDPQTLLLTGLTRDGVYLVENGEVVGAVNNFRFNESPVDLLGRAVRGRAAPSGRCRASGATGSPAPAMPRAAGPRLQHEQGQPGQLIPEAVAVAPRPTRARRPAGRVIPPTVPRTHGN